MFLLLNSVFRPIYCRYFIEQTTVAGNGDYFLPPAFQTGLLLFDP